MLHVKLDTGKDFGDTVGARVDSACIAVVGSGGNGPRQELRARTRALTIVWLFAFGVAALGTGEALSASRHKDIPAHRGKAAAAAARHGAGREAAHSSVAER